MKPILTFALLLFSFSLFAHEEPPKTPWEVSKAEQKRLRIKEAGIREMIRWKWELKDGVPTGIKHKNLVYAYDRNGNLINLKLYEKDSLLQEVRYVFNDKNQMIVDSDFDSNGNLTEMIVYAYGSEGYVRAGQKFDAQGKLIEKVAFTLSEGGTALSEVIDDPDGKNLRSYHFKFNPNAREADYYYAAQYDQGNEVLHVEKITDANHILLEKKGTYADQTKNFSHYYKGGTPNTVAEEITTVLKQSGAISKIELRKFNKEFFETEIKVLDGNKNLTAGYEYSFEKWI